MSNPVITGIARTPIGRYNGSLAPLRAVELGGAAIAAALERSEVDPSAVDEVLFGHVLQAGEGQITARQAAVAGACRMADEARKSRVPRVGERVGLCRRSACFLRQPFLRQPKTPCGPTSPVARQSACPHPRNPEYSRGGTRAKPPRAGKID